MRRRTAVVAALVVAASVTLPRAQLDSLETERQRLIYPSPMLDYLAPYAARCFESAMDFHTRLFGFDPGGKINVLLLDFSDYGRASAGAVPYDDVQVHVAPVTFAYETIAPNERMNTIMNHELVHVVEMDQASASDRAWRRFFAGKVVPTADHPASIGYFYLTAPRMSVPSWYLEGFAVFMETWMAGGIGRAQGSYDEMVFRSMVRDGAIFYDPLGLVAEGTKIDFQVGVNAYLYGTRFMSYLALTYGPETLISWIARTDGSRSYFAKQFEEVYGKPLGEIWKDWIAWEHGFQQANLAAIRQYPTTPYRDLSARALGSVSRAFHDPEARRIYTAFNYPGVVAHVGAISLDDGSIERLVEVKDPVLYTVTSLAWDPSTRTLFYTTDNGAWRDLRAYDLATKKARTLIKDARIGDIVFNRADGALWGLRQLYGLTTLVRLAPPYSEWTSIFTWPYGQIPYDLDVSPDGTRLSASLGEISGRHTLRVFDMVTISAGDATALAEVDFGTTIPSNFVFSPDGRYLYGSSYYTGVSNIARYEVATNDLQTVSNCETGMFRPVPLQGDEVIVFRYSGQGFVPAMIDARPLEDASPVTFLGQRIAETHPVVSEWIAGSPKDVPIDTLTTYKGPYRSVRGMRLESWYPIVEGYKDEGAVGVAANFSDPAILNRVTASLSYTPGPDLPENERLHVDVRYQRHDWRARYRLNDADFYDLFGPTKRGLKGYSVGFGHKRHIIYDQPRNLTLDSELTYYANLDRLPYAQNIDVTYDTVLEGISRLTYTNTRSSLGAVDPEKGVRAEALLGVNYVHSELIPLFLASFDVGFPLPLTHSSIWLRSSAGIGFGDTEDVFSNFYFGGFGNNWVDQGAIKRYREWYAFPGVEINDIGGRTYARTMIEWNLPPIRFENVGTPGFYLTWARPAVFVSGISTNFGIAEPETPPVAGEPEFRREVADAGVQIDFRFFVMHQLEMTFSAGYAVAIEAGQDQRRESMFSLKILR
jgi:hypothetical protein